MTLKFSEKAHRYTMDGKAVQGVTTILNKALPKPALPYWAAKSVAEWVTDNADGVEQLRSIGRAPMVEALKNVPWQTRDEAAIRGTDVHALAEKLIHGESIDVPTHLVSRVQGLAKLLDEFGVQPLLTEVSVGNRKLWYAGRLDTVSTIGLDNWLLDFKTSSGVYGETGLQTAAYSSAEFYVEDDKWDDEKPLPHIDRIGVIHITEDGSTLHELGDIKDNFKMFQHAHYLASRIDDIKNLVTAPLTPEEISA